MRIVKDLIKPCILPRDSEPQAFARPSGIRSPRKSAADRGIPGSSKNGTRGWEVGMLVTEEKRRRRMEHRLSV